MVVDHCVGAMKHLTVLTGNYSVEETMLVSSRVHNCLLLRSLLASCGGFIDEILHKLVLLYVHVMNASIIMDKIFSFCIIMQMVSLTRHCGCLVLKWDVEFRLFLRSDMVNTYCTTLQLCFSVNS